MISREIWALLVEYRLLYISYWRYWLLVPDNWDIIEQFVVKLSIIGYECIVKCISMYCEMYINVLRKI